MPARALNSVLFPVLGLPTRATTRAGGVEGSDGVGAGAAPGMSMGLIPEETNAHTSRLAAPQTQSPIAQTDFQRIAQWSDGQERYFFPFEQTHFHEALGYGIVAGKVFD